MKKNTIYVLINLIVILTFILRNIFKENMTEDIRYWTGMIFPIYALFYVVMVIIDKN